MESYPALHPSAQSARNSPLAGVLLTNADLDHVLGLFLLREGGPLRLFSPQSVLEVLVNDLRLTDILRPFCKLECYEPPYDHFAPLPGSTAIPAACACARSRSPRSFRRSARSTSPAARRASPTRSSTRIPQGRLVVAPDVAEIRPELQRAMESADAVLFDGTFWSGDEFQRITGRARTAEEMGHVPVADSLNLLRNLKARHKVYFHINNTNPILAPGSEERRAVETAGLVVSHDGLELHL